MNALEAHLLAWAEPLAEKMAEMLLQKLLAAIEKKLIPPAPVEEG